MQNNFSSMYNPAGGQQGFGTSGFGSPTYGGAMIPGQGFGAAAVPGAQPSFYPSWFAQYTGQQPTQIDQMITTHFGQFVSQLFNLQMVQPIMAGLQNKGEFPALMNKVRTYVLVLMLDKTSGAAAQPVDIIVRRVSEVVLLGEIVRQVGGPSLPFVPAFSQAIGIDAADRFNTYAAFESNPNVYQAAIQNAENQIRLAIQQQQHVQQNAWGFGSGFNAPVHPAAQAAIPSGNFSSLLNQATTNQNQFFGQVAAPGFGVPTNEAINQIGRVAGGGTSIYAIALQNDQARQVQEQHIVEQRIAENHEAAKMVMPADNVKGVTDAFTLAAKIQREGIKAMEQLCSTAQPEPEQPVAETPAKPKAVIPSGWLNEPSESLAIPEDEYTTPPENGLPSLGFYNMAHGDKTTSADFSVQATTEQHSQYAPVAAYDINDQAGDDDFLNAVEQQMEAGIQMCHEASLRSSPATPISTMDELVAQGKAQNLPVTFEEQELRIDFGDLDSTSRKNICRQYHIRVVPAYVMGRNRVIQIMKGKLRTIVVERLEEDMKYEDHETESPNATPVFATWDAAARDMGIAQSVMADAATNPVWSSSELVQKLDQQLENVDSPDEVEAVLSELADRSIIQIEGPLTSNSPAGDYQGEVLVELAERNVAQAGVILDNAIVEYERFETACLEIRDVNADLLQVISDATTSKTVISALSEFRKESTLPLREISRLHHNFTKNINQYLKTEFSNGWSVSDPIGGLDDLIHSLLKAYSGELSAYDVMDKLDGIYTTSARKAYCVTAISGDEKDRDDQLTVGSLQTVVLLPIYYSQYPLATLDDVGAIQKVDHPELYELLNKVYNSEKDIKIVTLDNYALTFIRSLGESDLFYLVDVTN